MSNEFQPEDFQLKGAAFIDARLIDQVTSLNELFAAFAEKPNDKMSEPITTTVTAHLESINIALGELDNGSTSQENVDELLDYAKGLEKLRIDFLNELDGAESPAYTLAEEDYSEMRDHLLDEECEDHESAAFHVYQMYKTSLGIDIGQLEQISLMEYQKRPNVKRKETLKKVGSQTLDVAKVGLGVFIGIAVAKKAKVF